MMRERLFVLLLLVVSLLTACRTDSNTAGGSILDFADTIAVKTAVYDMTSSVVAADAIISSPDSFLLGEMETDYGVIRADFLSQLACPEGYRYPDRDTIDSVCLYLYYDSFVGNASSPLLVDIYQMDRATLDYNRVYYSQFQLDEYCSLSEASHLVHQGRLVAPGLRTDSVYDSSTGKYRSVVKFRLSDAVTKQFDSMAKSNAFVSQDAFNNAFHGLYLTTQFGSSSIVNIKNVALFVYSHFWYEKAGRDTCVTDLKGFYANNEVRQLNRFVYPEKDALLHRLQQDGDSVCYCISPAGAYTQLSLPMREMEQSIKSSLVCHEGVDTLRPYINLAELRVRVLNADGDLSARDEWLRPAPEMLLIRKSSVERFFRKKELPADTIALLSSLVSGIDSVGNTIYYYSYDLSTLLTNQLRQEGNPDTLQMVLVPVTVAYESAASSAPTSVRQAQYLSATRIRSAQDAASPMSLKVVYAGLNFLPR